MQQQQLLPLPPLPAYSPPRILRLRVRPENADEAAALARYEQDLQAALARIAVMQMRVDEYEQMLARRLQRSFVYWWHEFCFPNCRVHELNICPSQAGQPLPFSLREAETRGLVEARSGEMAQRIKEYANAIRYAPQVGHRTAVDEAGYALEDEVFWLFAWARRYQDFAYLSAEISGPSRQTIERTASEFAF